MYEHARHSYKPFGQLEYNNFVNLLSELKILVMKNIQKKPGYSKNTETPVINKLVNRPRKRLGSSHSVSFCLLGLKENSRISVKEVNKVKAKRHNAEKSIQKCHTNLQLTNCKHQPFGIGCLTLLFLVGSNKRVSIKSVYELRSKYVWP